MTERPLLSEAKRRDEEATVSVQILDTNRRERESLVFRLREQFELVQVTHLRLVHLRRRRRSRVRVEDTDRRDALAHKRYGY